MGDTIFQGSPGTWQYPGGNRRDLFLSITERAIQKPSLSFPTIPTAALFPIWFQKFPNYCVDIEPVLKFNLRPHLFLASSVWHSPLSPLGHRESSASKKACGGQPRLSARRPYRFFLLRVSFPLRGTFPLYRGFLFQGLPSPPGLSLLLKVFRYSPRVIPVSLRNCSPRWLWEEKLR